MLEVGNFQLFCLNDGFFRLDGGAMFGIIPKPLWNKKNPADSDNRILLSLNCLLIKNTLTNETILVDTGLGQDIAHRKEYEKLRGFLAFDNSLLPEKISCLGIQPGEINYVVLTHLHFDHSGGNTFFDENEKKRKLTFENATYIVQFGEIEAALDSNPRTQGSYLKDSAKFLFRSQNLRRKSECEGREIIKGVTVLKTGGHTNYHQVVKIEDSGKTAIYLGDIAPTASHLEPAWIMGYDIDPLTTLSQKRDLLNAAYEKKWLLIFEHDPKIAAGYLKKHGQNWAVETKEIISG